MLLQFDSPGAKSSVLLPHQLRTGEQERYKCWGTPLVATTINNYWQTHHWDSTASVQWNSSKEAVNSNPQTFFFSWIPLASPSAFQVPNDPVISKRNLQFHYIKDKNRAACPFTLLNPFPPTPHPEPRLAVFITIACFLFRSSCWIPDPYPGPSAGKDFFYVVFLYGLLGLSYL